MNRFQALLVVFLVWAAIYLPGLGSTELKGEEGRRILPALTMIDSGNYIVPYIGGKPYLRKPPLVSWAIAGAFNFTQPIAGLLNITRPRNEWAARTPTVLWVLALALVMVAVSGRPGWLSIEAALVASLLFLTTMATVEKGRLAEIEGTYFCLSGIAMVGWMAWWAQGRSPWLYWIVPHLVLGLGLLAKGPLHLLFYYAIVITVLSRAGEVRRLWHPAHFVGLVLMAGMFYAWEIPYMKDPTAAKYATEVWREQSLGRLHAPFDLPSYLENFPRALINLLPWVLFVPLLWRRDFTPLGARELALFRGTRVASIICFFGLLLLPGMLPRYTLILLAPFAVLLAYALGDERLLPVSGALRAWWRTNTALAVVVALAAFAAPAVGAWAKREAIAEPSRFPGGFSISFEFVLLAVAGALFLSLFVVLGRHKLARPALLACGSAIVVGAGYLLYASVGIPLVNSHDHLRPSARKIDAILPVGASLVVYDPDYQPVLYYIQTPIRYAVGIDEVFVEPAPAITPQVEGFTLAERIEADLHRPLAAAPGQPWVLARQESRKRALDGLPGYEVALELPKPVSLILLKPGPPPAAPAPPATPPPADQ